MTLCKSPIIALLSLKFVMFDLVYCFCVSSWTTTWMSLIWAPVETIFIMPLNWPLKCACRCHDYFDLCQNKSFCFQPACAFLQAVRPWSHRRRCQIPLTGRSERLGTRSYPGQGSLSVTLAHLSLSFVIPEINTISDR